MAERDHHIIVFGNEKGGTGKSTLTMHVAVCLLRQGHAVGLIDLDVRQQSASRFLANRQKTCDTDGIELPMPLSAALSPATGGDTLKARDASDQQALEQVLADMRPQCRYLLIDCPGSYSHLSQLAHALADTLITPVNDSFVDLDVIGEVDPDGWQVKRLSHYAEMVWNCRKLRSAGQLPPTDWLVATNRVAMLASRNNQRVDRVLEALKQRIMFRHVAGLSERVVYRELFPRGLTMMDLPDVPGMGLSKMSHVAARQEVRQLVAAMNLPQ